MTEPAGAQERPVCLIGGHRHDASGRFCGHHLSELQDLAGDVARLTRELGYHLMPGSSGPVGEKVSTSRVGSPTPARLDVLSLIGPGGAEVRRDARSLAPLVRRWSTASTYKVTVKRRVDEQWQTVVEERQLRTYHAELVTAGGTTDRGCSCGMPHDEKTRPTGTPTGRPVMRMDNDQVGAIPPAEWADTWVRRWRSVLNQHYRWVSSRPTGAWVNYSPTDADQDKRLTRAGLGEWLRMSRGQPHHLGGAVAAFLALRVAYADAVRSALLGLHTDGPDHQARTIQAGTASSRVWPDAAADTLVRAEDALAGKTVPLVTHDPAVAEWATRYGAARTAAAVEVDAHHLATWLPIVAGLDDPDDDAQLGAFAAELRALRSELQHVLGETKTTEWLGRCPVNLVDADGEETGRVCGAGLWHDPNLIGWRVECARCHTSWPETDWLVLARRIRQAWPIDTRRRYTAGDRRAAELTASMPHCRGCDRVMSVDWQLSPARGDRERFWRPVKLCCPAGCLAGGTVAA